MRLRLADAAETESLGRALAAPLRRAAEGRAVCVHLEGPLGAGKTTLARGLLRGLGHEGRVRSPTFTLLEPYELQGCQVAHLDLYRLADPAELDDLGLTDLLAPGTIVLVEWPERGGSHLPAPDLRIALDYADEVREARLEAPGGAGQAVLACVHGDRQTESSG